MAAGQSITCLGTGGARVKGLGMGKRGHRLPEWLHGRTCRAEGGGHSSEGLRGALHCLTCVLCDWRSGTSCGKWHVTPGGPHPPADEQIVYGQMSYQDASSFLAPARGVGRVASLSGA